MKLDFHYDSSEVTLNLCLGKVFQGTSNYTKKIIKVDTYTNVGGSLYFAGLLKDPSTHGEYFEFNHIPGRALFHIGKVF